MRRPRPVPEGKASNVNEKGKHTKQVWTLSEQMFEGWNLDTFHWDAFITQEQLDAGNYERVHKSRYGPNRIVLANCYSVEIADELVRRWNADL